MDNKDLTMSDIIHLNVGGKRFLTSKQTLTWIPETFFTSLIDGQIPTLKDDVGAIFIDRDPILFRNILNYLRTKEISLTHTDPALLLHEAEFYGLIPLVKQLMLCEEFFHSSCGDVLFYNYLFPLEYHLNYLLMKKNSLQNEIEINNNFFEKTSSAILRFVSSFPNEELNTSSFSSGASKKKINYLNASCEGHKFKELLEVKLIKGHHNWIAIAYLNFITCYRMKNSTGWHLCFKSPYIEDSIYQIALHAKPNQLKEKIRLLGIATSSGAIYLWGIKEDESHIEIGTFSLGSLVDYLFFFGNQLVSLSESGKVGVWHDTTQHWQVQDVAAISSYDMAGSFLLLGSKNGSIYYIDMQKFPLRMKDNDLLVSELYKDPFQEVITSINVYGKWIEIAYGTNSGNVRIIVQHPETIGHDPQLFQTFNVHRGPVCLSEKYLISICNEHHVRTWSMTRFRGMISTQPGSIPLSSFKVITLNASHQCENFTSNNNCGPYGDQDDEQILVQKIIPDIDQVLIRLASNGDRVCLIKSVDKSNISSFCVYECEGSNRMGSCSRRFLLTGHANGSVQMWDLTKALEMYYCKSTNMKDENILVDGGPTKDELLKILKLCNCHH